MRPQSSAATTGNAARRAFVLVVLVALLAALGCDANDTSLPKPDCPDVPTKWTFAQFKGLGNTTAFNPFNTPSTLAAGTITGNVQTLSAGGDRNVTSVFAFMDNVEGGTAALRAVIYAVDSAGRPSGTPLAASAQAQLYQEPPRWHRFFFSGEGVRLAPGAYFIGIWSGGPASGRLYEPSNNVAEVTGFVASAAYDAGTLPPAAPNGSATGRQYALYGLYVDSAEQVDPSSYSAAPRAPSTSINLELHQLYMRQRVIEALQAVGIDNPSPDSGIAVDSLLLTQGADASTNPNMLVLRITPWLRGAQGQQVSLQRSYRVDLKLTPYLMTPEAEPNDNRRHTMLGNDESGQPIDEGIAIRFDLVELRSLTYDQKVECSNPNFDLIDKNILESLSTALAAQRPFIVPISSVTEAISKLGASTAVDGLNLGTDRDFKLGLHVNDVAGRTFTPETALSRFPSEDWAIDIDRELIKPAIGAIAAQGARNLGLTPNGQARVEIDPGGVLRVYQSVGGCALDNSGNVYARVTMSIVRSGPGGSPPGTQYYLRGVKQGDADARVKTCALFLGYTPFGIADYPNGISTATVGPAPTRPACTDVLATMAFPISASEWFYATALDTDGVFYIAGRSSTTDSLRGTRPEVPSC